MTISALTSSTPIDTVKVPYGASLSENIAAFDTSLDAARIRAGNESNGISEIAKSAMKPLDDINLEAAALNDYASSAMESGNELTPAEIVNLTHKSQEFMFHSQLTANIANRTADGLQQLFRQQG